MQALGSSPSSTTPGPHTRMHTHTHKGRKMSILKEQQFKLVGHPQQGIKGKMRKELKLEPTHHVCDNITAIKNGLGICYAH